MWLWAVMRCLTWPFSFALNFCLHMSLSLINHHLVIKLLVCTHHGVSLSSKLSLGPLRKMGKAARGREVRITFRR